MLVLRTKTVTITTPQGQVIKVVKLPSGKLGVVAPRDVSVKMEKNGPRH